MLQELAPCTCGLLYGTSCGGGCRRAAAASAFSLLFPMAGAGGPQYYYRPCGAAEDHRSAVDCTLSLGTPSTRRAEAGSGERARAAAPPVREGGGLSARRCANCDTTSTPLWRNGPRGPKSLCNACGIRHKKEERRAAAAPSPPAPQDSYAYGYARQHSHPPMQWGCYGQAAAAKMFGDAVEDGTWRINAVTSSPAFVGRERPSLFQYY